MIGLMIITHETLGESYTKLARHFFGQMPAHLAVVGVNPDDDVDDYEIGRASCRERV